MSIRKKVLLTGGAGFIGSHISVDLITKGYEVLVVDNYVNSPATAMAAVSRLVGEEVAAVDVDITNQGMLLEIFREFRPDAVVHCAGLKSVSESIDNPIDYYRANVGGTLNLLDCMAAVGCNVLVFSSSATVYSDESSPPYAESDPIGPINPYGHSKRFAERVLQDWACVDMDRRVVCLRYFNPIGNHSSGIIGENAKGLPSNLFPFIVKVATGELDCINIFGSDYSTPDGTGERDYLHVEDLAEAHEVALAKIDGLKQFEVFNIGTGQPTSVLELIKIFESATGASVRYKYSKRRDGDVASSVANVARAAEILQFSCRRSLREACQSAWTRHLKNVTELGEV